MSFTVFSDPHIGIHRKSHTTQKSRKLLAECIYDKVLSVVLDNENVVCAGDLFDRYSNSEDIIKQGANILNNCHAMLAGNHDLSNRDDKAGSLQLLSEVTDSAIAIQEVGILGYSLDSDLPVAYIPHHSSQELFDAAIDQFCNNESDLQAVFLHCNLDNSLADGSDTSLNLTREQAKRLLKVVRRLFIGHEHTSKVLYNDSIVVTGNTHPTSFSDISDKFIWKVDDNGELSSELVWSMSEGYRELEWTPDFDMPDLEGVQFVDIKGTVDAKYGADLATFVVELWKSSDSLLMVRNNVEITSEEVSATKVDFSDLPSEIAKQVEGTELQPLWEKYSSAEITED